jgi:hypothetical protein
LELAGSGLECLTALAPGLSEPAAVLHQLLRHETVQALCRQRAPGRGLQHQLVLATSALQARMVSICVLPVLGVLYTGCCVCEAASSVMFACNAIHWLTHASCRTRWMRDGQACAGPGALQLRLHASTGPGPKHWKLMQVPLVVGLATVTTGSAVVADAFVCGNSDGVLRAPV